MIEGDDDKEQILKAGFGSVAIWKSQILITSEEALYYCDISEFLYESEKFVSARQKNGKSSETLSKNSKQNENLYLKTSQFTAVQMSNDRNCWRIKGLHETEVAG